MFSRRRRTPIVWSLTAVLFKIEYTQNIGKTITNTGVGTFVDATISGGFWGATDGTLTFMVGYTKPTKTDTMGNRVWDILSIAGQWDKIHFCDGLGMGRFVKIAHN